MSVRGRPKQPFPWALWALAILTLAAAYVFFVLPHQLGKREMKIEFFQSEPTR